MTEVVAALIWDGDRFMICQRPAHKARGLLWEFVGGKVEAGETKELALKRECMEELAVTLSVGSIFMDVVHEYPDLTVHLTLFNAAIASGTPQKLEHNDIRWITVDEIPQYAFCPADDAILERLREVKKMSERYIAFDVETPNYANNRMSAIGITVIENGVIVDDFYSLINPEVHFDTFNIRLTGITPEMTADQPTFPQLWETIEPLMSSGVLVAHNAPFDLGVLSHCLKAYEIEWHPFAHYACTCIMGRACYPELANHKLNTLCSYLELELDHHNAGSDSRACAELLLDYMRHGLKPDRFLRRYALVR